MTQIPHSRKMLETIPVAAHFQAVALRASERGEGSLSLTRTAIAAVDRALRAVYDARRAMGPKLPGDDLNDWIAGHLVVDFALFEREEQELNAMREPLSALALTQ